MNVDERPKTLDLFDLSSGGFPFRVTVQQNIETRRALLADSLIFDHLLIAGGILNPSTLYPPENANTLSRLLTQIERCTYDRLKKDGLVYYLLKWHDADGNDNRAEQYAADNSLPPQFAMIADAYWALDNGLELERAVALLADRRLSRDYTSKILNALALGVTNASTTNDIYFPHTRVPAIHLTAPYILRYIRAAKPLLVEPLDLDLYLVALAEGDGAEPGTALTLMQAWNFQRTFPEGDESRDRLFRLLLDWSLTPKPRAKPLRALLSLPLSAYEQTLLKNHALNPPAHLSSRSLSALRDLATVRLLSAGMQAAAVGLDRQFAARAPPAPPPSSARANYAAAAKGPRVAREDDTAARRRAEILSDVRDAMPAIERTKLDDELSAPMEASISAGIRRPRPSAADLSSSWMEIDQSMLSEASHSRKLSGRGASALDPPHAPPIAETAGAPRFGLRPPRVLDNSAPSPSAISSSSRRGARRVEAEQPSTSASAIVSARGPQRVSLFETSGSAHSARNAFYQPPSSSKEEPSASISAGPTPTVNGHKGPSARVSARVPVDISKLPFAMDEGEDADVSRFDHDDASIAGATPAPEMDVDESAGAEKADTTMTGTAEGDQTIAASGADETVIPADPRELAFSVFSQAPPASPPAATLPVEEPVPEEEPSSHVPSISANSAKKGRPLVRTETERMQPPGAFFTTPVPEAIFEEDEQVEQDEPAPSYVPKRNRVSASPAPERMTTRRVSATMSASKPKPSAKAREAPPVFAPTPKRVKRAIPGAIDAEEEDDDGTPVPEEEGDTIAPLPRSKGSRVTRGRGSNGTISDDEEEAPQRRRRSSRISQTEVEAALGDGDTKRQSTRGKTPVKSTPAKSTPAATPRTRRKR